MSNSYRLMTSIVVVSALSFFAAEPSGVSAAALDPVANLPEPAPPAAVPLSAKMYIVFFGHDSAILTPAAREIIAEATGEAGHAMPVRILVTGYADGAGMEPYNGRLSADRAEAVKSELVRDGLNSGSVAVAGLGPGDPLVSTEQALTEAKSSRVIIELRFRPEQRQASR